jgi:hypothetical protein
MGRTPRRIFCGGAILETGLAGKNTGDRAKTLGEKRLKSKTTADKQAAAKNNGLWSSRPFEQGILLVSSLSLGSI